MKRNLMVLMLLAISGFAAAATSEQALCTAAKGTFLSGKITKAPYFAPGSYRQGVELSHTHVALKADQDGKTYDVAIDNVYATGYDVAGESVPQPLKGIALNSRLEVCGIPFPGGIHWVHSNCGVTPTKSTPNGFVKALDSAGRPGANMTGNQEYCYLFN